MYYYYSLKNLIRLRHHITSSAFGTFSPHPAVGHLLLKEKDGRLQRFLEKDD
jgi:hypothetical protein